MTIESENPVSNGHAPIAVLGVEKCPTGIVGFDEITEGGLPRSRSSLVMGGPGCGKTVFALQTLVNGIRDWDEPGIFVAWEEDSQQIRANAASFKWHLDAIPPDKLFFLDARLAPEVVRGGDFELTGVLAAIEAKAKAMGAKRIVFDSIDVLLAMLNDPLAERREMYRLRDWLAQSGMTGIITARAEPADSVPAQFQYYSFLQFMVDCIVLLHHRLQSRFAMRGVRVVKYRGACFSPNEFPFVITPGGIEVGSPGVADLDYLVSTERVSSGVRRLDTMLDGGYYRGSSVLISGAPGAAKSTLCGAFVDAACKRGERSLYVSFDESASQIVRNLASVGINLAPHLDSGLLRIYAARTGAVNAEEHVIRLRSILREQKPTCLVIDPVSALTKAGGLNAAADAMVRLLDYAKAHGITILLTSLLEGPSAGVEATSMQISTIADTWIHLTYLAIGGERNRALTIIKSRGMRHSNQVRELILGDDGITLADVYTAGGEVLMGTARWEKELVEQAEQQRFEVEATRRRRSAELAQAELRARIAALEHQLALQQYEMETLTAEQATHFRERSDFLRQLRERRGADVNNGSVTTTDADDGTRSRVNEGSLSEPDGGAQ